MYEVSTGRISDGFVNFSRQAEADDFDVIALDWQGEFFAAADEAGKVAVYRFDPPQAPKYEVALIEAPGLHAGSTPLALAFDSRRRWLAGVRGTQLVVWDLQHNSHPRQIEAQVSDLASLAASLAFDPSGHLLGVGTIDGWQVWDVEAKQLVAQGTDVEVYAVTFSQDGRLFTWGDTSGTVHLWGVPDP